MTYYISTTVAGRPIGDFRQRIEDPFVRHTVDVSWRDLLKALLRRRSLRVVVSVGADIETLTKVLELNPDYLGPTGSKSRIRWEKELNAALGDL